MIRALMLGAGMIVLAAGGACVDPCVLSLNPCDTDQDCEEGRVCRLRRAFDLPCVFSAGTCEEGTCGSVSQCGELECCDPERNACVEVETYAGDCDELTCRDCSIPCGSPGCVARPDAGDVLDAGPRDSALNDAVAVDQESVDIVPRDRSRSDTSLPDLSLPDSNLPDLSTRDATPPAGSCHGAATSCPEITGSSESCASQAGCWPEISCVGLPPADCGIFELEQECAEAGCNWGGDCADTARPCSSLGGDMCPRQVGCEWNRIDVICEGSAATCDSFDELSPCVNQLECWWYPACEGAPPACDGFLSELSCQSAPYCGWEMTQCSGSVHACSAIDSYAACLDQAGCEWS